MYLVYNPLPVVRSVEQKNESFGRFYTDGQCTPVPSVTKVVSDTKDERSKEAIAKYLREFGDSQSKKSRNFGTSFHAELEGIMQGKFSYEGHLFQEKLQNISEVLLSERKMVSGSVGVGGTCDALVRTLDNKVTLLDFKTSYKPKKRSYLSDYAIQLGFYARLIEEVYELTVDTAELWFCYNLPDEPNTSEYFIYTGKQLESWKDKSKKRLQDYHDFYSF